MKLGCLNLSRACPRDELTKKAAELDGRAKEEEEEREELGGKVSSIRLSWL